MKCVNTLGYIIEGIGLEVRAVTCYIETLSQMLHKILDYLSFSLTYVQYMYIIVSFIGRF